MARRRNGRMNGEQYLANANPSQREVHDLDKETTGCQIDKIIAAGHERPYNSLGQAQRDGYDNCAHCLGGSRR